MKTTRRLAVTAVALILAAGAAFGTGAMTASAAAETVSVNVAATDDHTYVGYQIFSGNVGTIEGNSAVMADGDLALGNGVNADALYAALGLTDADKTPVKALRALKDKTSAEVMAILKTDGVLDQTNKVTLSQGANTDFVSGYIYIEETSAEPQLAGVTGDLLKITNDVDIAPKIGAPGVEKKVQENTREITSNGTKIGAAYDEGYNDAADYSIGDMVPFTIYGTIPSDFDGYDHYFYEFTDRLAPGFSAINPADVRVFIDDTEIINGFTVKITNAIDTDNSHLINVTFNDLKLDSLGITKNSKIKVQYEAELGENASFDITGNTNEVYITYTKDHDYRGFGYTDSGKEKTDEDDDTGDDTPGKTKDDQTDDTPSDGTVVFTYKLQINKIDDVTGEDLENARFVLYNADKSKVARINDNNNIESWETVTDGMNLDEYKFTIPYTAGQETTFGITGIDSGIYYLAETDAPEGYVKLTAPVEFEITTKDAADGTDNINITGDAEWTGDNTTGLMTDDGTKAWADGTWVRISSTDPAADAHIDSDNVSLDLNVANVEGIKLPETGGIGTKMFYGIGGAAVIVSSVLLIAKKRMKKAE